MLPLFIFARAHAPMKCDEVQATSEYILFVDVALYTKRTQMIEFD